MGERKNKKEKELRASRYLRRQRRLALVKGGEKEALGGAVRRNTQEFICSFFERRRES